MPRIVSLISSGTEIVHALGQFDNLVGRSHECDFPEAVADLPICTRPTIPVCGDSRQIDRLVKDRVRNALSVYEVFPDVLERLQPTHIVTQTQCRVCAVSLEDVERALAGSLTTRPKLVALEPNSLEDIWSDIRRVAIACGVAATGEEMLFGYQDRMRQISVEARCAPKKPRVACIEWHEPLMAAGNWVPELVDLAGAENLFGQPGLHSPWMSWQALVDADPDVIITMPCGFDLNRTRNEMYWLTDHPNWPKLRAVQNGEVYLTDGNQYMNRPGPRVVESLQILAEILHPTQFEPKLKGSGWEQLNPNG